MSESKRFQDAVHQRLYQLALDKNCSFAAWIHPADIPFVPELREMCEQNSCGQYNTSWKGPPAIGPIEDLMKEVVKFQNGLIVQTVGQMEDSFDYESMMETKDRHQKQFYEIVTDIKNKEPALSNQMLALTVGCCDLCGDCTYPESPCTRPDEGLASVEAYGINVNEMLNIAGLKYNNGVNTVSFVGLILF